MPVLFHQNFDYPAVFQLIDAVTKVFNSVGTSQCSTINEVRWKMNRHRMFEPVEKCVHWMQSKVESDFDGFVFSMLQKHDSNGDCNFKKFNSCFMRANLISNCTMKAGDEERKIEIEWNEITYETRCEHDTMNFMHSQWKFAIYRFQWMRVSQFHVFNCVCICKNNFTYSRICTQTIGKFGGDGDTLTFFARYIAETWSMNVYHTFAYTQYFLMTCITLDKSWNKTIPFRRQHTICFY